MTSIAKRTTAAVALVAMLALGTPIAAIANTTTTTTIVAKAPVITTLKQWRAANKLYLAKLNVINLTFLSAVTSAKLTLSTSLADATDATARISARATYRFAITEATIARSNALMLLGKAPLKPSHKTAVTTTTF